MPALPFNLLSYPFFPSLLGSASFVRSLSSVFFCQALEAVLQVVGMKYDVNGLRWLEMAELADDDLVTLKREQLRQARTLYLDAYHSKQATYHEHLAATARLEVRQHSFELATTEAEFLCQRSKAIIFV